MRLDDFNVSSIKTANGTIMSTLSVTQYCHVHFNGGGVVVLECICTTPKTLYKRLKSFLKPTYQRILRICTMALLYYYD